MAAACGHHHGPNLLCNCQGVVPSSPWVPPGHDLCGCFAQGSSATHRKNKFGPDPDSTTTRLWTSLLLSGTVQWGMTGPSSQGDLKMRCRAWQYLFLRRCGFPALSLVASLTGTQGMRWLVGGHSPSSQHLGLPTPSLECGAPVMVPFRSKPSKVRFGEKVILVNFHFLVNIYS